MPYRRITRPNRRGSSSASAPADRPTSSRDGYTLLFSSLSLLVNHALVDSKVKYDPFKDFVPVSNAANLPMVIVTAAQTPINSVPELIAAAKAQ